ncbi:hypothetical protein BH09GEM1_BH09GEM1_05290 [soil metagenome]
MTSRSANNDLSHRLILMLLVVPPAWAIWRLALILPRWVNGAPPAYPGQFGGRLRFAITMIGFAGSLLAGQGSFGQTRRGRVLAILFSLLALVAVLFDVAMTAS